MNEEKTKLAWNWIRSNNLMTKDEQDFDWDKIKNLSPLDSITFQQHMRNIVPSFEDIEQFRKSLNVFFKELDKKRLELN